MEHKLFKAAEVCVMLGLSRSALQRLVTAGVLKPQREGKLLRFDVLELNKYLAAGRPTPSQARPPRRRK